MSSTWVRGIVVVVCAVGLAAPSWAEGPLAPANDVRRQMERVVPADKPVIPNVQSGNAQKGATAPRGESLRPEIGVGLQDLRQQQQITNPMKGRDLQINIKEDLKAVDQQGHGLTDPHGDAVGTRGLGTGNSPFLGGGSGGIGSGSLRGPAEKIKEKATITGEKYGDTFGADRINGQNAPPDVQIGGTKGRAPGGFTGGGRGNAASGDDATVVQQSASGNTVTTTYKDGHTLTETKNPDGSSIAVSSRTDGSSYVTYWDKNGDMTKSVKNDKDGSQTIQTWNDSTQKWTTVKTDPLGGPVKTPNPEADDSGGGKIIVLPGSTPDRAIKAGMKTRGQAGGPGDGRNPASEGPSGVSEHAGTSIMMGVTRGQDAPEKEVGGTINMDKMMEINTKVNPGAK